MRIRWLPALIVAAGAGRAVVLDRIAVTVGKDVITETEVEQEIRVTAFLNGEPLDFSPKARREAAERLVDQQLIRRDMQLSNWPEPEASEADRVLAQLKRQQFANDAQYREALSRYGITEDELKQHLLWQLAALRYTDYRFRPGIPPSDQALSAHLEKRTSAAAKTDGQFRLGQARTTQPRTNGGGAPAPGGKAQPGTADTGGHRSIDEQMEAWLKDARSRTRIVYHEDAFR